MILVVIDTWRGDHLGAAGGRVNTPNLDSLAEEAVVFSSAFSHIPITGPSHASLFTGLLPWDHRVRNNTQILNPKFLTLAEMMQLSGRRTAAFVSLGVLGSEFGMDQGFDEYHDSFDYRWWKSADEVNLELIPWLDRHHDQPFFLFVHYSDPHEPYAPPNWKCREVEVLLNGVRVGLIKADGRGASLALLLREGENELLFRETNGPSDALLGLRRWTLSGKERETRFHEPWIGRAAGSETMYEAVLPAAATIVRPPGSGPSAEAVFVLQERFTKDQYSHARERYAAEVRFVDREIGRLFTRLKDLGLWERSLILVTSDHGEGMGDHGLLGHIRQLYDSLLHVPLIIHHPGGLPAGRIIDNPVSLMDLSPTLLELMGMNIPTAMRGESLVPLIAGDGTSKDRPLIAETWRPSSKRDLKAVRWGDYKYIRTEEPLREELYHLEDDPRELSSRIGDTAGSERENTMAWQKGRELLETAFSLQLGPDGAVPVEGTLSEEDKARLRSLGYVEE